MSESIENIVARVEEWIRLDDIVLTVEDIDIIIVSWRAQREALTDALPYVKSAARFRGDKRAQQIVQECNTALLGKVGS